ncbi:MAG: penicillin-binding protein 2, partial [Sedimentisphaerales bacterium]|nr:penicillin-binding protein 2 [Sedimentisphaerales bacterium]
MKLSHNSQQGRVWGYVFWSVLLVGLIGVLSRCWYLQYYEVDQCRKRAERQQRKLIPLSARRGLILDRTGRVLAISVKKPTVCVDPSLIKDKQERIETAIGLSEILALDADELYESLRKRSRQRYMLVKRFVGKEQAEQVKALGRRGVMVNWEYQRQYPMGELAAHVLGFTNVFGKGLEGIERQYDEYLLGESGKIVLKKDVRNRPVGLLGPCVPSTDGRNAVLCIDAVIQACVEEELKKAVEKFHAKSGTVIVMDPYTGEVLALANYPTFIPSQAGQCDKAVLRNRALTDPYEPGSTFKPVTVSSAIEGKYFTLDQKIDCLTGPYAGKGFGRIPEYKHYFGLIPVADVIVRSSNIGVAKISQKMGADYFYSMIEKFGFGKKTGIDLPEPGAGLPREKTGKNGEKITLSQQLKKRYGPGYTLTRVAYGQTIAVTPIQLLRAFCCIANGGRLVRPRITRGIIDNKGDVIEDFGRENQDAGGRVLSEKVARSMVEKALTGVVARQGGTAHKAHLEGWTVFGKTGTAQVVENGRYVPRKHISSFIAGAPAEKPRVCVLVLVREPDHSLGLGYTGGMVAAPAVKKILQHSLAYLDTPKRLREDKMV